MLGTDMERPMDEGAMEAHDRQTLAKLDEQIANARALLGLTIDSTHFRGRELGDVTQVAVQQNTTTRAQLKTLEDRRAILLQRLLGYVSRRFVNSAPRPSPSAG